VLRRRPGLVVAPAIALVAWLVYGSGFVDYDALYALIWGDDLAGGHRPPDFDARHSPTSHPLATLVSAPLSQLGSGALDALQALSLLSFGALGWAAYRLGERTFGRAAGATGALILLTRPLLVKQALSANVDVPFVALLLGAAAMEAARPRRGWPVLLPLALAGLLRPEAWLLAFAYAAWLLAGRSGEGARPAGRERAVVVALALAGPLGWALFDWVVAGDPLASMHATSQTAERIGRPRGLDRAVRLTPGYLIDVLTAAVAIGGAGAALLALRFARARALLPVAVGIAGGLAFLALGVGGQPLLARYLFVPGAMLALFFAAAATAWWIPDVRSTHRRAAAVLTVAFAALFVAAATTNVARVRARVDEASARHALDAGLPGLVDSPAGARALRACAPLQVDYFQTRPLLAFLLDRRRVESIGVVDPPLARSGVLLLPRRGARGTPPPAFRPIAGSRGWTIVATCPRAAR
jgi:hypothetical protein